MIPPFLASRGRCKGGKGPMRKITRERDREGK